SVNLFTDNLITELQAVADMVEDEDLRATILNAITIADSDRENKIAEIRTSMGSIFDAMQADMIAKSAAVAQNALTEWNNLKWWEKLFAGSRESYVDKALQDYQKNIVDPTMERIQESMEKLGIEGELFASDAMKAIMNSLFDYNVSEFGIVTTSFKNTLTEETKALLEQYGIDAEAFAKAAGLDIVKGLEKGVEENLSESWFQRTFGKIPTWFKKLFKIESPSKVFQDYGGALAEGLKKGVDEGIKKKDYDNIFTRIGDSIKSVFGIKSPSTVMISHGLDMGNGLAIGIQRSGENVVSAMKQLTNNLKTEGLDPFQEFVEESNQVIQDSYLNLLDAVEDGFIGSLEEIMNNWETAPGWFKDFVFGTISTASKDLKNSIKEHATEGAQAIKDSFQGIPSFFENIMQGEGGVWRTIQDTTSKIAGAFADMALSWMGLGDDFAEKVGNPILKIIADLIREVSRLALIAAFKWVVSIILTKLGVPPTITKSILAMKDGGFVDQGQMFIAREAGPELVGTIGNRTAVVNN